MGKMRRWALTAVFLAFCAVVLLTLAQFTQFNSANYGLVTFDEGRIVRAGGETLEFDPNRIQEIPEIGEGDYYYFHGVITDYPFEDGYLQFQTCNLDMTMYANGREFFRSVSAGVERNTYDNYTMLPLPGWVDSLPVELELKVRPTGDDLMVIPPLVTIDTQKGAIALTAAIDYYMAMPLGACAVLFILLLGFYLLSIYLRRSDWPLLALTLAAGTLLIRNISAMNTTIFMPKWFNNIVHWDVFNGLTILLLIVYLILGRKPVWRKLGLMTLWSALGFTAAYLVSKLQHSVFANRVDVVVGLVVNDQAYNGLLTWVCIYLVAVCGVISAYGLLRAVMDTVTENRTLTLKNSLMMDNYRLIEEELSSTAALRHDWKNQLMSLDLLYRQGDMERLGERLREIDDQVDRLKLPVFSDNFIVNAILQKAYVRASHDEVKLIVQASLPEKLDVDASDLCSFLMNLLDNALEAAAHVKDQDKRFVDISLKINQGFLAVSCRNIARTALKGRTRNIA